jgi:hypothetical protein
MNFLKQKYWLWRECLIEQGLDHSGPLGAHQKS